MVSADLLKSTPTLTIKLVASSMSMADFINFDLSTMIVNPDVGLGDVGINKTYLFS